MGVDTSDFDAGIAEVANTLGDEQFGDRALYIRVRWLVRDLALRNPLLDFDSIVFSKRRPTQYSHMSDQYYGWWSKPGGGLYIMSGYKSGDPDLTCITDEWPEGTFLRPELSHDGSEVLFGFCKYYPETSGNPNKVDKGSIPEDAFYHIFEMNADGSDVRQLTHGRYDDFDARYLPNGEIVFLSTRRGVFVQCTEQTSLEAPSPERCRTRTCAAAAGQAVPSRSTRSTR